MRDAILFLLERPFCQPSSGKIWKWSIVDREIYNSDDNSKMWKEFGHVDCYLFVASGEKQSFNWFLDIALGNN